MTDQTITASPRSIIIHIQTGTHAYLVDAEAVLLVHHVLDKVLRAPPLVGGLLNDRRLVLRPREDAPHDDEGWSGAALKGRRTMVLVVWLAAGPFKRPG